MTRILDGLMDRSMIIRRLFRNVQVSRYVDGQMDMDRRV